MIVFAAIVPSSPLLIPSIGKEHLESLKATQAAYRELRDHCIATRPDILVIVPSQFISEYERFEINQSPHLHGGLTEFGDLDFSFERAGALAFCHHWKEQLEDSVPVHLCTLDELPYDATIPLYILTEDIHTVPIALASVSRASWGEHFHFGKETQAVFSSRKERIAVVISGTLSTRLSPDSPAGFSLAGKSYDSMLIKHLRKWDHEAIRAMDPELVKEADPSIHRALLWMLGVLSGMNISPDILCYESPFGIGTMSAELTFVQ